MNDTSHHDAKIAAMTFSSVYPHYVTKIERKGQSKDDLHTVIKWLTGFDEAELQKHIDGKATFEEFFALFGVGGALLIGGAILLITQPF